MPERPIHVYRRRRVSDRRRLLGFLPTQNAHQALGKLEPGIELLGFSKGQFSLINLIRAVLDQIGPASVTVATWTAAKKEIGDAEALLRDRRITHLRWLVDFSFPRRQPQYCALLRETFGDDVIRVTKTHAKFVVLRTATWDIVIRTSMNLNVNPRFELFEISDDKAMAEFLEGVTQQVFEEQPAGAGFTRRPIENVEEWQKFGLDPTREYEGHLGACYDNPFLPGLSLEANDGKTRTPPDPDPHP